MLFAKQNGSILMKETTLLVLAAGMGSRFGGLKQMEPLGPHGESIIEYSIHDAVKAGFNKAVVIIKNQIAEDFIKHVGSQIEKAIKVEYVFQEIDKLPEGYSVPEGRIKPWGTGHAMLCARDHLTTPFATINGDDYYGQEAFKQIHDHLVSSDDQCMIGYELGKTITDEGTVSRGVCEVEDGYLKNIVERTDLDKNSGLSLDTIVSMNLWGFTPKVFDYAPKYFLEFLDNLENPLKSEFYLPLIADKMIQAGNKYKVINTKSKWYGVTYKNDAAAVKEAFVRLTNEGLYPKEKRVND